MYIILKPNKHQSDDISWRANESTRMPLTALIYNIKLNQDVDRTQKKSLKANLSLFLSINNSIKKNKIKCQLYI